LAKTLYIDTSDRNNKLIKLNGKSISTDRDLLITLDDFLKRSNVTLKDIEKIKVHKGPGSFTSLRIGISIVNTLNYALGLKNIKDLDIPKYGKEPNITLGA